MNLYTLSGAAGGSYTTPRITYGQTQTPINSAEPYTADTQPQYDNENWAVHGAKLLAAAPLDVIDSMAAIIPGVERGTVNDAVYDSIGLPGVAQYVRANQGGVEITSGILGAVTVGAAAEIGAAKLAGSAWFAATGLGRVAQPVINMVSNAERAAQVATLDAAAVGRTLAWYQGENLTAVGARAAVGLAKASVSEAAVIAALHKNTMIWSDDMSSNIFWAGVGLVGGTGLSALRGRGNVLRWANSEAVRNTFADAADPHGFERLATETPISGAPRQFSTTKLSSTYTTLMLNARSDDSLASSTAAAGGQTPTIQRNAIQLKTTEEANRVLQAITGKGDSQLPGSGFSVDSMAGQQILETAHNDPTVLLGASSVASLKQVDGDVDLALKNRKAGVDALKASSDPVEVQKGLRLEQQQPLVLLNNTLMTTEDAKPFLAHEPQKMTFTGGPGVSEVRFESPFSGKKYIVQQDGSFNGNWMLTPIQDLLHLRDALAANIQKLRGSRIIVTLPANPSFHQIDYALELHAAGGDVDFLTHAGFSTPEAAQMASLSKKAALATPMPTLGPQERFRLNLPMQTSSERISDPSGATLKSVINQAGRPGVTLDAIQALRIQMQRTFDVTQNIHANGTVTGDLFGFNISTEKPGKWMDPVLGFYDDTTGASWHRWNLGDSIAEDKAVRLNGIINTPGAVFASGVTKAIVADPAIADIQTMSGLADSQLGGTANAVAASASQVLTQGMRFRNTPALRAAQALRRVINRVTETTVDAVLTTLAPHTNALSSIAGSRSKVLLHSYLSAAGGWDIKNTGFATIQGGTHGGNLTAFVLAETDNNAQRLGRNVIPGETLRNADGTEVVLDDTANAARVQLEDALKGLLTERNAVRVARGQEPVNFKGFFVPPPSTAGKKVGFTLDANNRVVPGMAVVAASDEEFTAKLAAVNARMQPGQRFMTKEEIALHEDIWDQAQMDFIDPTQMAAPAGQQRGGIFGPTIDPKAYENALQYIKHGYEQVANGVVRTTFDGQLRTARIRSAASAVAGTQTAGVTDVWQTFDQTLMGRPGSTAAEPRGLTGVLQSADKWADNAVSAVWPALTVSGDHLRNLANMAGLNRFSKTATFADLTNELGPHTPFHSAQEYALYTRNIVPPWKTKEMSGHLNRFSAAIILRWLELPNAVMNMTGIVTNMPGLLSAKNVPVVGRVGKINVVDTSKILARGFKRMLSEHSGADWDMMVRNGDTTQDVSEMNQQLALIKGRASWMNVMAGNPSIRELPRTATAAERSKNLLQRKGIEGMVSIMQDTSESLSRRWAHFTGLELADYHGIVGMEARHQFARQIANDAIANYDPLNRPEVYQSAFGSMYGLFTSYAQNYYQRMFRWMEEGDYKALGKSLVAQSMMFGMNGLPGYQQIANLVAGEDDNTTIMDGLYKRLGPATASVVAHGGFNQLTSILSLGHLPAMSLSARGDMNFRSPALDFVGTGVIKLPIGLQIVHDLVGSSFDVVGKMVNGKQPVTAQYAAETLARQMPNRVLHGALSILGANGVDTDVNGNVMADVKSTAESMYRILGFRSGRQQAEIDAYYMNQKALQIDSQRMDGLRTTTRALVRSGNLDRLHEVFEDYMKAGGKPWNYPQWIQGIIKSAPNSRTQNQLLKSMRSPGMQGLAQRIELFTAPF